MQVLLYMIDRSTLDSNVITDQPAPEEAQEELVPVFNGHDHSQNKSCHRAV